MKILVICSNEQHCLDLKKKFNDNSDIIFRSIHSPITGYGPFDFILITDFVRAMYDDDRSPLPQKVYKEWIRDCLMTKLKPTGLLIGAPFYI